MSRTVVYSAFLFVCVLFVYGCGDSNGPADGNKAPGFTEMPSMAPEEESSTLAGEPAPDVELEVLDGKPFRLSSLRGEKVVMLDFWATWCGPCVKELPLLAKIAEQYRARGVDFYAVNQGEEADEVREFLKEEELNVAACLDRDGKAGEAFGADAIPLLVVIDKAGVVRSVHVGYREDIESVLQGELDALLAAGDPASSATSEPAAEEDDAP